jgi:hypothetical protein
VFLPTWAVMTLVPKTPRPLSLEGSSLPSSTPKIKSILNGISIFPSTMAEENHLEKHTVQLAKRVELLLNRLPAQEQGQQQPPEAIKLRQKTSFNEFLAKKLGSLRAECREKLKSIDERSTTLSREAEKLSADREALEATKAESLRLRD